MEFIKLSLQIQEIHNTLYQNAVKAVNSHITIRNWLIGCYIVEFEQHGADWGKLWLQIATSIS